MPVVTFPVKAHRHDPYRTFKFQVLIESQLVAVLRKLTALKRTAEVAAWCTGCDRSHERKPPGRSKYEPIALEQGLTHDPVIDKTPNHQKSPMAILTY